MVVMSAAQGVPALVVLTSDPILFFHSIGDLSCRALLLVVMADINRVFIFHLHIQLHTCNIPSFHTVEVASSGFLCCLPTFTPHKA